MTVHYVQRSVTCFCFRLFDHRLYSTCDVASGDGLRLV